MRAVAVCWSFGRASLCELLGMWQRQTRSIPLVVWLDGVRAFRLRERLVAMLPMPAFEENPEHGPYFIEAPRMTLGVSLATMRNHSLRCVQDMFSLTDTDAFLVIEDDDYYASNHVAAIVEELETRPATYWLGSTQVGQQWQRGQAPERCRSIYGPGPHAQWAMRFGLWREAGGYPMAEQDDMALAERLGWDACWNHSALTYVRREHGANLSRLAYDVEAARAAERAHELVPVWNAELDALEAWCQGAPWTRPS